MAHAEARCRSARWSNFGYDGTLLLPVRGRPCPPASPATTLTIKLHADWLVCKDVCIPESGDFALRSAGAGRHGRRTAALFDAARAAAPQRADRRARRRPR